jgi:outer membrane protein assembly factor BamB
LLYAIDLKTQKMVWSAEFGPLFVNGWGDGPRGTPTVDGELVYAIGGQGNLVCVNAGTGKKVWSKGLKNNLNGQQMSGWGYTESPLVDGNLVVATPGGQQGAIAAFDKKTGELKWRSTGFTDPAAYSSLVVGEIGGVRQYVQMTGQSVASVAARDGKPLWQFARKSPTAAIPTPIVKDNYVYVSSGYGTGCTLLKIVAKSDGGFDAQEVYSNKDMENHHGGVVLVGDYLYGYSKGGWTCQEFKTGKVAWTSKALGKGCLTCADGHLYCYAENDGTCCLVEANPTAWKETGRFKIPQKTTLDRKRGSIWTHPVVANGKLYLRDQDLIFCFDVSKGQ